MSPRDSGAPPPEQSPPNRPEPPDVLSGPDPSWTSDTADPFASARHRPLLVRRPALRWVVPAIVLVLALAVGGVGRMLTADAAPSLPPRTAAELLVDLQTAVPHALSGTVVQRSELGMPDFSGAGSSGADFTSMLTGVHTLRVWYGGEDRQRLALLGPFGESDVVRNGNDVWTWSSEKNTATHTRLTAEDLRRVNPTPSVSGTPMPTTPQDAADKALAAISPTTEVTTDGTARVAGRAAYELVLKPKDAATRIGQVRVAIDAEKKMPLRVRVYARGASSPAYEVGFTQVSFATPDPAQFEFTPPAGATVNEAPAAGKEPDLTDRLTVVGSGWTQVAVVTGVRATGSATSMLDALPKVSGSWGSGRLLESNLLCALITDDGRLVVGAVDPERLYEAAAR
ncbi:LolA family protein [Cryptosporangium aurantiacum]|uniref:Outer membrane lipoprotein-sorting protein n=1 Tax=Cryptosporangium aurantiacum TaxID=134849 RepID=A0A1M7NBR9_9ACTN|nr:sigma-E factor regulatory protein RseB domain-containing protein [Cryptosporangium aurantiacum]SHN00951.1 Outer membrane lipoprotein-sorting protein [Cryptosporangium aurantiacum]